LTEEHIRVAVKVPLGEMYHYPLAPGSLLVQRKTWKTCKKLEVEVKLYTFINTFASMTIQVPSGKTNYVAESDSHALKMHISRSMSAI